MAAGWPRPGEWVRRVAAPVAGKRPGLHVRGHAAGRWTGRAALAWAMLPGLASPALGATRRAVLVGIDTYAANPRVPGQRWSNLEGAVNDVLVMHEILVARHGFAAANILVLCDTAATRTAILEAIRRQLVLAARPDDVCVFYFAGHGSQVANAACPEGDCRDETIVPADANRGAPDIRDKELQRLFNDVLDRGALLTVLFDSCHSGSISRGLANPTRTRFLTADPRPAPHLAPDPRGAPAARGALVFTAAQEFQPADEILDEQGVHHGLFSMALARVLSTVPVTESAENVFRRVRAIMASNAWRPQEPRLEGVSRRCEAPLFAAASAAESRTTVAVERIGRDGTCVLQGGLALGLCAGSELRRWRNESGAVASVAHDGMSTSAAASLPRLRIESHQGPNRCTARVVAGDARDIAVGDLFEPDVWAGCGEAFLRVWLPPAFDRARLDRTVRTLAPLRTAAGFDWVDDPTVEPPTHVLEFGGTVWSLSDLRAGTSESLGPDPTAADVLRPLRVASPTVRLFVHVPPPAELVAELGFAPRDPRSPVDVTPRRDTAHYLLTGRLLARGVEYAWVRPNVERDKGEIDCPTLPLCTDWCGLGTRSAGVRRGADGVADATAACARQLHDLALRVGKVRMWLQLDSPPDDGRFPYRLVLQSPGGGEIEASTTVHAGEQLEIALAADPARLRQKVRPRYVYVFTIDCNGKAEVIFPRDGEANYVPTGTGPGAEPERVIRLDAPVVMVAPPYGVDTFVLLTMTEPLPDPGVLSGAPVKTRADGRETPLAQLLTSIAAGTRGIHPPTPADWSVQRLFVRSAPGPGGPHE